MLRPHLLSRIEQGNDVFVRVEERSQVGAFVLVAMLAGKGKAVKFTASAMFQTNDVFNFKSQKEIVLMKFAQRKLN